jgi:4-diphosphocytidyl-2-C-methyl-D-erythritol kinase
MLTVRAPAKINLTLEVLGKRPDGFHEIRSIAQSIDLCDALRFENGEGISFQCDMKGWKAEKSLASKAADLMREYGGSSRGALITIEKRIPLMSGLGGDSSDAAAVLRGLNELWELDFPNEIQLSIAAQLGSDVFFFLDGGTALAEGRGEKITPLPSPAKMWVVLVIPDVPVKEGKTGRMYASLKKGHFTDGTITKKVASTILKGYVFAPSKLFNTFENIAFSDDAFMTYKEHLIKMGAPHVHLAGSGPALFTLYNSKAEAGEFFSRCESQGLEAYLTSTR